MRSYSIAEFKRLVESMRELFDLVRVVDPANTCEVDVDRCDDTGLSYQPGGCYAVWQTKTQRCHNCISLRAVREDERQCKFEFIGDEIFYVVASPLQVLGTPLALELICRIGEEALLHSYRGGELVERVAGYNEQFRIDEGTGLNNRHYLDVRLRAMLEGARAAGGNVTLALVDVDDFAEINERYGHAIGNQVLLTIGQVLSGCVSQRRGDFVVRFGGDEFAMVFDNIPQELLQQRIHKLMEHVRTLRIDGLERAPSVSIGCYRSDERPEAAMEDLIAWADKRLYMAKEQGRDRAVYAGGF